MRDDWRVPPGLPTLADDAVHVWRIPLERTDGEAAACERLLSPDERARVGQLRLARDRRRFVVSRAALRSLLGQYLHALPSALAFTYGPQGKPALAPAFGPLAFNVSHSGELALIAVRNGGAVGVDVECVRPDLAWEGVAARFFCAAEIVWLDRLPPAERLTGFFQLWTRKEALLKGRGEGVWRDLDRFDVSQSPPHPAQECGKAGASAWFLRDLEPGDGYKAAVAVPGLVASVETWHWPGLSE